MPIFLTLAGAFGALLWLGGGLLFMAASGSGAIHEAEAILVMGFGGLTAVVGFGLGAAVRALQRMAPKAEA